MKAASAFALLASVCFLTVTVDCSRSTKKELKPRLRPSRSSLQRLPFCSRMCRGGAGRFANEIFPPYRCSCSRSGAVFGDRCYDSPYSSRELWQQYEFVRISVMGRSGYQAVSSCSPGLHLDACKEHMGHLPPVTSSETNITYANYYCAWCNRDFNYLITWNVDLICPSSRDDPIYERLEYRSHEFWMVNELRQTKRLCKFRVRHGDFRTVDGLEIRPFVTVNKISRCSPSWKDSTSAKKCASYEDPVFLKNTAYRNPDCARCNFVNLSYVDCMPDELKTTRPSGVVHDVDVIRYCLTHRCHLDLGNARPTTFSTIFNVFHVEKPCPKGERFDPITNECRRTRVVQKRGHFRIP